MREYLKKLPKEIRDLIYLAGGISMKNGVAAYLVGGFVRDLVLGVKNLDVDIVVEGDGIKFAESLAHQLGKNLVRHRRFGTASIILDGHLKVDIATARRETYPHPASLPVVTPGSLRDDLLRRDFTINAMAIEITKGNFVRFIDSFSGRSDLKHKKVRTLHYLSFIDDPTRILRAIRFEQRYGFNIEASTLKALKEAVKGKMLEKLSPHRLRDELVLMLKEACPIKEIRRTQKLVGFGFISPRLSATKKNYDLLKLFEKEITWFVGAYPGRRHLDKWLIYLMGLTEQLNANKIKSICKKFAFRKGEEKRLVTYKKIDLEFISELNSKSINPSRIFRILEPLSYEVILAIKAKFKKRNFRTHLEDFLEIYNGMHLAISGDDLHRLGFSPGPLYQKIFSLVLDAKLNGLVKTKQEELGLIKDILARIK